MAKQRISRNLREDRARSVAKGFYESAANHCSLFRVCGFVRGALGQRALPGEQRSDYLWDDFGLRHSRVGQRFITAMMAIGESIVIEPELVQQRRM